MAQRKNNVSKPASNNPQNLSVTKQLSNRQLQALIDGVNSLIAQRLSFSTSNAFRLVDLASAVEDAYKPASKLMEEFQKEVQAEITAIADEFKAEHDETDELDPVTKKKIENAQEVYMSKVAELMDILVEVTFIPITKDVFRSKDGKELDVPLAVVFNFRPFMK